MIRVLSCLMAMAVLLGATAARAAEESAYRNLNRTIVTEHILPRYDRFASESRRLAEAAEQTCAENTAGDLSALRKPFLAALEAWQAVQHVRFGPVEFFSRASRIAFWPDPRNSVDRQVSELLSKRDPALLEPAAFAKASVAVQGFPALESLLYGDEAARDADSAAQACALARAITVNLRTMAAEIDAEWRGGDDPYAALLERADDVRFRKPSEVTVELFKSLYTAVELVADHKLARPLGTAVQAARPRLAEYWRSKHSLDAIRINLRAAQALYESQGRVSAFVRDVAGNRALDDLLRRAFTQTLATADGIAPPLEDAIVKAPARAAVEKLSREAKALKTLLVQRLAPALEVPVGFNQLDGD